MEKGIKKIEEAPPALRLYPKEMVVYNPPALADFITTLKTIPDEKTEVKTNKVTGFRYIPIGLVESKLDHYFAGLWETKKPKWQVIANEIVMTLELKVLHPIAGIWLRRIGAGAVQIQLRAEYEVTPDGKKVKKDVDVMDVSKKIVNTLGKDFPHVKAEAVKNAAKSFGAIFGRDLNREFDDDAPELTIEEIEADISMIRTKQDLSEYYKGLSKATKTDKRVRDALKQKEIELNKT